MIKTKSMFDEPIKIGLIRFADLYDHSTYERDPSQPNEGAVRLNNLDISQQPTLLIYTTGAGAN